MINQLHLPQTKKNQKFNSFKEPQKLFPISAIDLNWTEGEIVTAKNKLIFFHKVMIQTIDSFLSKRYSDFDGHTTSTCCHGIALLIQELILLAKNLDLNQFYREGIDKLSSLLAQDGNHDILPTWYVPAQLLDLARLYILNFAKKIEPNRGIITCKSNLKLIHNIGTRFCDRLVDNLQKHFSNLVAFRYGTYLNRLTVGMSMHGIPIKIWGKYVSSNYLRKDKYGIYYASSIFSMQVSLAYLIATKSTIAIVNDITNKNTELQKRYLAIFQGNGIDHFLPISLSEVKNLSPDLPIIIFGGLSHCVDQKKLILDMKSWPKDISSLILACDVWYPQFPRIFDDPLFNSSPIIPEELTLNKVISKHSEIGGVSVKDPSLFCLTHIYTASVKQVVNLRKNKAALPQSFIPMNLLAI